MDWQQSTMLRVILTKGLIMKITLKYASNNIQYVETNVNFINENDLLNAKVRPHAYDCEIKSRLGDFTRRIDVKEKHFYSSTLKEMREFITKLKEKSTTYYVRYYKAKNSDDKYCHAHIYYA